MTGILAIETATDACSVALYREGGYVERHELAPRQHNRRLFAMLRELLPRGDLRAQGIEALAFGSGPGSFTGLRIAASAVQGLAFSADLPAVSVSTLACQAQTAAREANWEQGDLILSTLDAGINEAYCALYRLSAEGPVEIQPERVAVPGRLELNLPDGRLHAVGSGCRLEGLFSPELRSRFASENSSVLPRARDLVPLALRKLALGEVQSAFQVQPVYVKEEVSWKKLSEQGRGG
jgi:tRNA threonylcarbamoyladenosine biosynthesis protein TsaB